MKKLLPITLVLLLAAGLALLTLPADTEAQATDVPVAGGFKFTSLSADTTIILEDWTRTLSLKLDSGSLKMMLSALHPDSVTTWEQIPFDAGETHTWVRPVKAFRIIVVTSPTGKITWE